MPSPSYVFAMYRTNVTFYGFRCQRSTYLDIDSLYISHQSKKDLTVYSDDPRFEYESKKWRSHLGDDFEDPGTSGEVKKVCREEFDNSSMSDRPIVDKQSRCCALSPLFAVQSAKK